MNKICRLAVALIVIFLLNACAAQPTTPFRIPNIRYPDTGQNAYLWSSGSRIYVFELSDYATITKVDDADVPSEFLPSSGGLPKTSYLLKIPVGKHTVQISYKERALLFSMRGPEVSRQTLIFIAKGNHIYAPFVDDRCARTLYWIEDWGTYTEGAETTHHTYYLQSDLTKPVVAGRAPTNKTCEEIK
jgi:hypothetical protein